jgi:hypothetical protein
MKVKCDKLLGIYGAIPVMRMLTDVLFRHFSALSDFGSTCRHADALNTSTNCKVTPHTYVDEICTSCVKVVCPPCTDFAATACARFS